MMYNTRMFTFVDIQRVHGSRYCHWGSWADIVNRMYVHLQRMYASHDARHDKSRIGIKYASDGIFTLCHCINIDVPFLIDCFCSLICIYFERKHVLFSFVGDYVRIDYVFTNVDYTMPCIVFLLTLSHLFFIMQLNTPPFTSRSNLDMGSPSYTIQFCTWS